ncbi:phosphoglycerate kinase [Patescibacteria group bacterium]|nr:phosphoglycerate kinase [Patescibacteria group bacterium]
MTLRSLPESLRDWRGKRVLVRVDWNIPLDGSVDQESGLKLTRSFPLIDRLRRAGAIVVLITHVGRPTAQEMTLSTKHLIPFLKKHRQAIEWIKGDYSAAKDRETMLKQIVKATPGSVFLLENLRFFAGEEKNTAVFVKTLAMFGEIFINEAFAVCHRAHASVVGVANLLPSYAGPALEEEVTRLEAVRSAPKKPAIAFFGGKKISSKLAVLEALQKKQHAVYLGGAMAVTCEAARGKRVGASYLEPGQKSVALKLLRHKNMRLPLDYIVATELKEGARTRITTADDIHEQEIVVDVGPQTLIMWADAIRSAAAIVWNGPMGVSEISAFAAGSRGLARYLGYLPHKAEVIVGGGDTIPLLAETGVINRVTYVSTGGGAMLAFLVEGVKLPGIQALFGKKTH